MTPRSSELVLFVLGLFMLGRKAASGSGRGSTTTPGLPDGAEVERVRTGEPDVPTWFRRRLALTIAALRGLAGETNLPDPRLTLTENELDRVALSIVSQWAHETKRGANEFNFNLGGFHARRSDNFFTAKDTLTPGSENFRWSAYPDLPTAVDDQVHRLVRGFPEAFRKLVLEPESSAWIAQLGRSGYFTGDPADYARAWAMHRTELGRIPL